MANTTTCKECGRVTLRVSWSGLRVHEECKQKGFLKRTGKSAPLGDQRAFFAGNVTDRVVRAFLSGDMGDPMENPHAMPDMVSTIIDTERARIQEEGGVMRWKNLEDRSQVEKDCIEAVKKIQPALMKYVLPFEYQADFKFQAPVTVPHPDGGMESILLIGFMDIIVRDDKGRWWVWDVKHTRDDSYWRKTVGQLGFYDLAVELMFGQPTIRTGLLQPLCKQPVLPYANSESSRAQLMQRIVGMANDIWMDDKAPRKDTKFCNWCEVKHACSKFQPVQVGKHRRIAF